MSTAYNPLTDDAAEALVDEHRRAGCDIRLATCEDCGRDMGYFDLTCDGRVDLADHRPGTCGEVANHG